MATPRERIAVPLAVAALGFSAVITQITVIREFINVFEGNEIVLGVLFALWLLITGLGAWAARFSSGGSFSWTSLRAALYLVAFLPIVSILAIRLLRNVLFTRGELPGISDLLAAGCVVLLPFCFLSGALLTLACAVLARESTKKDVIGRVYAMDSVGSILGGVLFTFVLVFAFGNLTSLCVPAAACLAAFLLLAPHGVERPWRHYALGAAGLLALAAAFFLPLERLTLERLYAGQEIVDVQETPYGRLAVTREHGQTSFFQNGGHLFSTPNVFASEEMAHFALPQLDEVRKVLLVSGGIAGVTDEILKYGVERLDYVEMDPAVIDLGSRHLGIRWPEAVRIHREDGRRFIERAVDKYDAVIVNAAPPDSLQLSRFYSLEFFRSVKSILRPGGIVCFAVPGAENYISPEQASFLSSVRNALRGIFEHILVIPGDRNIFIASDRALSEDVAPLLEQKKIETVFVNRHYLAGRVTPDRIARLTEEFRDDTPENRDFRPAAYFFRMGVWLSMFGQRFGPLFIGFAVFIFFYFIWISMVRKALFSTGFMSSAMEVIILLTYQVLHGTVYTGIGMIIASFMLGLALGSITVFRLIERGAAVGKSWLLALEAAMAAYIALYMLALLFGKGLLSPAVLSLLTTLLGALAGAEFPLAGRLVQAAPGKTAGALYAADFIGASLGALAVSLFLIPLFGLWVTCLALLAFKTLIIGGLFQWKVLSRQ